MQIRKKLQINIIISALTAFVIILAAFFALHRVNRARGEADR
jgi:hypothetical protein